MTGIIILAAGSSSRLGTAKQALQYQGQTLMQRAIQSALAADCDTVAIVLGANAEALQLTITDLPVHVFFNDAWEEGMASSICCGISELQKTAPQLTSIVLMLCDQPYVDASIINQLIQKALPNKIIASAYNNTIGPPALFDRLFFQDLLSLSGHEGAKKIMLGHPNAVIEIPFPLGAIDIDTIADYDQLSN
ncbi:nucleotidyltransferase family protein [Mucilaginibacter sp.]|uniref:nucleotidyltransferase family protein n=1 Tax=Mucilaginibacter sp. TaxID=1882438 RepID=UPI0026162413|nr:nucleotidyltransferase family protein [Mucilaginibacter sp.]MDB4927039.1 MobA-like protein [Mucilaginibacter sp.]